VRLDNCQVVVLHADHPIAGVDNASDSSMSKAHSDYKPKISRRKLAGCDWCATWLA
jgi:hypothetical protein